MAGTASPSLTQELHDPGGLDERPGSAHQTFTDLFLANHG